ncbi:MAG: DUF2017 family protein [Actinomycetota bacterium]
MRDPGPRVRRTRRGTFELRLPPEERAILRSLPAELRDLLESDDPALQRLFPVAYPDDPERAAEFEEMVRDDLLAQRRSALDVMEATLNAKRIDEDQLTAWLGAINDVRLVLGTRLEVTEDMDPDDVTSDDPRAPALALYYYLGWLEEQIVAVLAEGIDASGAAEDG